MGNTRGRQAPSTARLDNQIGVLWTEQAQDGHEYFAGTIDGERVVVFRNTAKGTKGLPDWRVLRCISAANPEELKATARVNKHIGVLWTERTQDGHEYFVGTIHGKRVVVFRNNAKGTKASPDWRVLLRSSAPHPWEVETTCREKKRARQRAALNHIAQAGQSATQFAPRLIKPSMGQP
jgi:uncharacterized protein (DUF736 family)